MLDRRVALAVRRHAEIGLGAILPVVCSPSTDPRADVYGRLRNYIRICNPSGAFISVPKNGCTPDGPTPTSEEWKAIDEQRKALGYETIGCLVTKKPSNFLDVAARETAKVTAPLDRYVPGWATALDFLISPLVPFLPLLLGAIASAVDVATSGASALIPAQLAGGTVQSTLAHELVSAAKQIALAGVQGTAIAGSALAPVSLTLAKATQTAKNTRGGLARQIAAVSLEVTQGLALTASIAGGVIGAATWLGSIPAAIVEAQAGTFAEAVKSFDLLSRAVSVVSNGAATSVSVLDALDAANAAKKGARLARQAAEEQNRALVAEQRALDAEVARLERELAARRASVSPVAPAPAPVARVAAPASNTTRLLLAGLGALLLAEVLE